MVYILSNAILELYNRAATDLPKDVEKRILAARKAEKNNTAAVILEIILKNISLASKERVPICQDTGTPIFYVTYPKKYSQKNIREEIIRATKKASKEILRGNSVDSLTGKNIGNSPVIKFEEWNKDYIRIDLMLKGGGSENIGVIYKLPDNKLNAERDIKGIKICVIDAVFKAQGFGCPPYIIGVGIAGSSDVSFEIAKKELFRKLNDKNSNKILDKFEKSIVADINKLGIGPNGLGGNTTVLAVKANAIPRHPASFFVAVVFSCWALRRHTLEFRGNKYKII